jgi:hypothetical protein
MMLTEIMYCIHTDAETASKLLMMTTRTSLKISKLRLPWLRSELIWQTSPQTSTKLTWLHKRRNCFQVPSSNTDDDDEKEEADKDKGIAREEDNNNNSAAEK